MEGPVTMEDWRKDILAFLQSVNAKRPFSTNTELSERFCAKKYSCDFQSAYRLVLALLTVAESPEACITEADRKTARNKLGKLDDTGAFQRYYVNVKEQAIVRNAIRNPETRKK
jgi:hypothetical protein